MTHDQSIDQRQKDMKFRKRKIRLLKLSAVTFLLALSIGFLAFNSDDFKLVKSLEIYYNLFRELTLFYVDEINPEKLVHSSIDGMLKELDPYTTFIPESEKEDFNFMTTGQYGGIGALIRKRDDYAIIAEPYENFPAARAGLRAGDIILSIDGKSMKDAEISHVSENLKGAPDTEVRLQIKRLGSKRPLQKTLIRKIIKISNVPYHAMLTGETGYIRLSNFTKDAASETKQALTGLLENHQPSGIILDLRNNPGGLLIESVDVCNLFIEKDQEVVSTRGKVEQWDQTYKTRHNPVDTAISLVVMVSRGSASASEIVAGAMQDLDRAVILGQRTFGKGLVQTTRELVYNTQLKVTTAKYYIPSGRCIQALDYSNRNENGSVGNIPDSLVSTYSTRNGRTVYDGGGIRPDLETKPADYSQFTKELFIQNMIFDFATRYRNRKDSIPGVHRFRIRDDLFNHFREYVTQQDFSYQTKSEQELEKLMETARKEKYYDLAEDSFLALGKKLAHNNEKDFVNFRDEIERLLEQEIAARYYYQKGRIKASMESDQEIKKAVSILEDPSRYNDILKPVPEKHSAAVQN